MSTAKNHDPQTPPCNLWRNDLDAVAVAMADALRGTLEGWKTAAAPDIVVEDCSGMSGGRAYKLTTTANPAAPSAMLHILSEYFATNPHPAYFERIRAAHDLFSDAGVSPRRVIEDPGREWFVEEWGGNALSPQDVTIEVVEEIGRLVARTHAIDTAWYDEFRRRQCERHPALSDAPKGSHIWWYAALPQYFMDTLSESAQRMWIQVGPVPATPAGSRLVTTHGDIAPHNVVRSNEVSKLIDMDTACVTYAVHDISYSFGELCTTNELKEAFVRSYLVECGLPASTADVFALRLDAERCKIATHQDAIRLEDIVRARQECDDLGPLYPRLVATADRAMNDPHLAREIVERGFGSCAAVQEIQRDEGMLLPGTPVTVHRDAPDPLWRSGMTVNWDGSIQPSWQRHWAFVLGLDDDGQIILTNRLSTTLRLRMAPGGVPVTGLRAPISAAIPLLLAGRHAGKALVLSEITLAERWNENQDVTVGSKENALAVHVEPDGVIRLADRPQQAFDCNEAKTGVGVGVALFHNHCYDNQKFILNDNAMLSPIGNRNAVWGMAMATWCSSARRTRERTDSASAKSLPQPHA